MSVLRYAQRTGEPLVVGDATRDDRFARDPYFTDAGCCSLLALPILSRGTLRAVLLLENRLIRGAFTAERLDAVKLIAGQLAVSLDNAQLYAELTTSRARIVAAADQARRRIERDLHDGAQQRLVSLALQLRAAQAAVPPELGELGADLARAAAEATGALEELREIARGIHPAILAEGGLRLALKTLARRCPIPVDLQVHADGRLPEPVEVSAYYVIAEALTNAARHARASAVTVTVEVAGDSPARRGPRRRRRRRRLRSRYRPGRPQGPRGGTRRPDLPPQPARGGNQPARRAPAHHRTAASPPASPRPDCWVARAVTVPGGGRGNGRTGQFSCRPEWGGLLARGMTLVT